MSDPWGPGPGPGEGSRSSPPPGATPGYGYGGYPPSGYSGYPGPGGYAMAPGPKPDTYLVWAILSTLMCCMPFGVVAIIFAAQVDGKWNAGDVAGAMDSSNKAKMWSMISAGAAAAVLVVYAVFFLILVGSSASTSGY